MAFQKLNIPLKLQMISISEFKEIEDIRKYLEKIDKNNIDVLVCFDWGEFYSKDFHSGHVCLLDRVFINEKKVRIIDPEYESAKWVTVAIGKLYQAMKFHYQQSGSGGFWEVSKY